MLERIFCARSKNCLNTKLIFNDTFNRRSQYTKLRKWWKLAAILLKQRKEYVRNTRTLNFGGTLFQYAKHIYHWQMKWITTHFVSRVVAVVSIIIFNFVLAWSLCLCWMRVYHSDVVTNSHVQHKHKLIR